MGMSLVQWLRFHLPVQGCGFDSWSEAEIPLVLGMCVCVCVCVCIYIYIYILYILYIYMDFPGGSDGKVTAYNLGDPVSIPGLGRSPGEGNGCPL